MEMFRICTEDKNREGIEKIVSSKFEAYTLLAGRGVWRNTAEQSLVIEILTNSEQAGTINQLALEIKQANQQEAVLVQRYPVDSILI
jgi:hypothetical protein